MLAVLPNATKDQRPVSAVLTFDLSINSSLSDVIRGYCCRDQYNPSMTYFMPNFEMFRNALILLKNFQRCELHSMELELKESNAVIVIELQCYM